MQTIPLNLLILWLPHDAHNQNNCFICMFKNRVYNIWPVWDVTKIKCLTLKCVMSPHRLRGTTLLSDAVPVPERPYRIAMVMYGGIWIHGDGYIMHIFYLAMVKLNEKKKSFRPSAPSQFSFL